MKKYLSFVIPLLLLLFSVYSAFVIYSSTSDKTYNNENHLTLLAKRFSIWKVSLSPYNVPSNDYVDYKGQVFLYFGPFPSLILLPLVFVFDANFSQIVLGISSLIICFIGVFYICRRFKFSISNSLWLSIFFVFSTSLFFVGVINISAYQVQAVGVTCIILALAEYFGKRRMWVLGILLALAGMTRMPLYLSTIFFILEFISKKITIRKLLIFFLPIIISILILGLYNYRRFRSFAETGYQYNIALKLYPMSNNVKYGFLNPIHIPANLYTMFIKSPDPIIKEGGGYVLKFPYLKADPWGIALWYTSPLFLLLFTSVKKTKHSFSAYPTIILLMIPSLLYFGVGFLQFGYRYALDFIPFLFILLLDKLQPKLPIHAKILIILGVLFNCLYMASVWNVYPFFKV